MPKFSVLSSSHVWNNLKEVQLQRCIKSVTNQSFTDWEMVIVDDGSKVKIESKHKKIRVIKQLHLERIIAMNKAMADAKGEWFVFLNSDDELFSYSLQLMNEIIKKNPQEKMFNMGSLHVRKNWGTQIRGAFEPKKEKVGHEMFGPGNIVDGTFFFHRSIYDDLGAFPPERIKDIDCSEINYGGKRGFVRDLFMVNPWDFSAAAQLEFPEIREYFLHKHPDHPKGVVKELGNPWGNDYFLFYKYTRKYHSKPYQIPIIIIHHEGRQGAGHELTN